MTQIHTRRNSAHPLIDTIWTTQNTGDGIYSATPDGSWDLIVLIQSDGSKSMMITGQATRPMDVPYKKDTGSVVISFVPGAYIPAYAGKTLIDSFELLSNVDADRFVLCGQTFTIPTYETAEDLVESLIAAKLLFADPIVYALSGGESIAASQRSSQRHFVKSAGITQKNLLQIERAQRAVRQLQRGEKPSNVAANVGYTDQPHMAHDLKKIMGIKPSGADEVHKL
jgi:AraC-like DNA-binding protein